MKEADPKIPQKLNGDDRAADNWRPLLAIADAVGGEWPQRAREAAEVLSGETSEEENSARIQLLVDIRDLFDSKGKDQLPSEEIVLHLIEMEERPWPEWKKEKPLTKTQLARLLNPFEVRPDQLWIVGADGKKAKHRGYKSEWFKEVFVRYLPSDPVEPVEPSTGRV